MQSFRKSAKGSCSFAKASQSRTQSIWKRPQFPFNPPMRAKIAIGFCSDNMWNWLWHWALDNLDG
jgi:hypothetical protein